MGKLEHILIEVIIIHSGNNLFNAYDTIIAFISKMYEIYINQVEPSTSINIEIVDHTNEKIKVLELEAQF